MENENVTSTQNELATPVNRILAALIDGILVSVVAYILMTMSSSLQYVGSALGIVYMIIKDTLPALQGQSIGKKAMNIMVVNEDTGESIEGDYAAGAIRALPLIIPFLNFIGIIVETVMLFSDDDHRRFGDKWGKTKVIKK